MRPLVLLNARAAHGRAAARWRRVARAFRARGVSIATVTTPRPPTPAEIDAYQRDGHEVLAAAGGDGTVHALINAIMDPATDRPRIRCAVGAIGLGSSNDFHKPFGRGTAVAGAPLRLDATHARAIDLGKITATRADGTPLVRYFTINASIGVTALGNQLFNQPGPVLALLKRWSTPLAIACAAAQAIVRFRPVPLTLEIRQPTATRGTYAAVNLGILKNVHFTGGLRYDTPVTPDDGHFDVNLYEGMSRPGMLLALVNLARGRFLGTPGSHHWRATQSHVELPAKTPIEADGEVYAVSGARFDVVPRCLRVCGPGMA